MLHFVTLQIMRACTVEYECDLNRLLHLHSWLSDSTQEFADVLRSPSFDPIPAWEPAQLRVAGTTRRAR